ncbi:MAG: DUF4249 family protein [Crocinitomicaceae bacterium]|nr:DUF4249 family protein [Crocinitomicaceae bacterium]
MMKLKLALFLNILVAILFVGCETDSTVAPPPYEKKPVIMSLITPQSNQISAQLSYTKPYFGKQTYDFEYITDAKVFVIDLSNNDSLELRLTDPNKGIYEVMNTKFSLDAGKMFKMNVELANGKSYHAFTTIPPSPDMTKLKASYISIGKPKVETNGGGPGFVYETNPFLLNLEYTGVLGENFYFSPQLVATMVNDSLQFPYDSLDVEIAFRRNDEILKGNAENMVKMNYNRNFESGFNIPGPFKVKSIWGSLYTMDKPYKDYYMNQLNNNGIGNSPFSEPSILISNFSEGAIGIFGSYDFTTGVIYRR